MHVNLQSGIQTCQCEHLSGTMYKRESTMADQNEQSSPFWQLDLASRCLPLQGMQGNQNWCQLLDGRGGGGRAQLGLKGRILHLERETRNPLPLRGTMKRLQVCCRGARGSDIALKRWFTLLHLCRSWEHVAHWMIEWLMATNIYPCVVRSVERSADRQVRCVTRLGLGQVLV